jgi:hypothetical protein
VGRIEHSLLVRDMPLTDLRPSPATTPYHKEVTDISFLLHALGHFVLRLLVQNGFPLISRGKDFWCRMDTFGADGTLGATPCSLGFCTKVGAALPKIHRGFIATG